MANSATISTRQERDNRATVVVESIMAGCNIFYSYQHWDNFYKFTESGLEEAMEAFASNRTGGSNPLEYWDEQQAQLLDTFTILIVKHLAESDVLNTACLTQLVEFAETNKAKWLEKGGLGEMKSEYLAPRPNSKV